MKILLINKYHYRKGGAERAYFDMADILTAAGHQVAFFSMDHPRNEATVWSTYFVSRVEYQDKHYSVVQKLRAVARIIWNHEANKKLEALIQDFQPDVAHAHNIYHQLSPSIFHILKKRNIPIVLTLHDYKLVSPNYNLYTRGNIWNHSSGLLCMQDRCIQGSFGKSAVCAGEKWVHQILQSYQKVDVLISPSRFLASKAGELGWKGKSPVVLPNPLRQEELDQEIPTEGVVKNKLVFFGRLSEEKGVDTIMRALAAMPQKELTVIGEGPVLESLRLLAVELGISEQVHFIGTMYGEQLKKELRTAEAVLVSSVWYENLPYVVTESLALGLVVVASDSGGIPERITHGENGFLYALGDSNALLAVLQDLERRDLTSIRRKAQESVQDLSPKIFKENLETIYQSLL